MKKFGKKNNECYNNFIFSNTSDFIDENNLNTHNLINNHQFFEDQLSKKLDKSNKNQSDSRNFFQVKKKETNKQEERKEINFENNFKKEIKSSEQLHSKTKIESKRLSELENNNLYFILRIDEDSDKEEIKKSYKNLCRIHHPDKGGNSDYFQKIHKAYEILSNDYCRKLYDKFSTEALNLIDCILLNGDLNEDVDLTDDLDVINLLIKNRK